MVKVIAYEFTLFSILISATQTHEIRPFVFLPKSPRDSVVLSFPTSLIKITFLALDIDNEGFFFFCYSDFFCNNNGKSLHQTKNNYKRKVVK
jgi:hypothetical protein